MSEDRTAPLGSMQALLTAIPDMVFRCTLDMRLVGFHGNHDDLLLPPEDFLGRTIDEVLPAPVAEAFAAFVAEMARTQQGARLDYVLGDTHFEASGSPMANGEAMFVVRNVTERVQATQRLERLTLVLTQLAACQRDVIVSGSRSSAFDRMLEILLEATESEYGFIGEVVHDPDGCPYLRTYAVTDIAWSPETRAMFDASAATGLEFRNLDTLFGRVVSTGEALIANDAPNDPRRGGLPPGHPPLNAFLGLPIHYGEQLVGMAGLANRPGGYSQALLAELEPCRATMGTLIIHRQHEQERQALERRLAHAERLASVGRLAAGVAHEINNPLQYVLVNLGSAQEDLVAGLRGAPPPWADSVLEALGDAQEGGERIRDIVQGLGRLSAPQQPRPRSASLRVVLDRAIAMTHHELRHQARLVRHDGAQPFVMGDETELVQVFVNLLVNAIHALEGGRRDDNEITLTLSVEAGQAVVCVQDSGRGIPSADLTRIFDPFFTSKPEGRGSGLGLGVCHRIVTKLGGELTVESELGRGTSVEVRLPLAPTSSAARSDDADEQRPRILVVDDEALVARALARALAALCDVHVETDATAARDVLLESPLFDLVITDAQMPNMTGVQLYDEVIAAHPEYATRFVILTGVVEVYARDRREGIPVLAKPIDIVELRRFVAGRLAGSGAHTRRADLTTR